MLKVLDVYLYNNLTGKLTQDKHGAMSFSYTTDYLAGDNPLAISFALPLREQPFTAKECHSFFAGLLPEEHQRKIIARNLGISANNDFSMLEKIGGECAGAITFTLGNSGLDLDKYAYQPISENELAAILNDLPNHPLLAGYENLRLSLAGAQDKLVVTYKDNALYLPLFNAPSTHILKPANPRFNGIVYNEAFCMQLAKLCGIPAANTNIGSIHQNDYILVERYDRLMNTNRDIIRIHQEDFCQALGIAPENKYQAEGGPSIKQCFELVKNASSAAVVELLKLLDLVIFNWLIGNCDAHGKNFSLLYYPSKKDSPGIIKLAPAYDLVCTILYEELTSKMAMKFGGEYSIFKIHNKELINFAIDTGLSKNLVMQRIKQLALKLKQQLHIVAIRHEVCDRLCEIIDQRCDLAIKL